MRVLPAAHEIQMGATMFEIIAYIVTGVLAVAIGINCGRRLYVEHQEFQRRRMEKILDDVQKRKW